MMEDVECDFTVSTFVAVSLLTSRINGDVLDGVEATTGELPRARRRSSCRLETPESAELWLSCSKDTASELQTHASARTSIVHLRIEGIAGIWSTSKQIESHVERITGEAVTLAGVGICLVACRPASST